MSKKKKVDGQFIEIKSKIYKQGLQNGLTTFKLISDQSKIKNYLPMLLDSFGYSKYIVGCKTPESIMRIYNSNTLKYKS